MLTSAFIKYKESHEFFEEFSLRITYSSTNYPCIILENESYVIKIYIEESEVYVSLLLEHKTERKKFYALTDLSLLTDMTDIFSVIKGLDREAYYQELNKCLKMRRKRKNAETFQKTYIYLIFKLLEVFLTEQGQNDNCKLSDGTST